MSDLPDELPSDPAELRVFAAALLDRCARLERLLKLAKDAQFGRSSEKLDADQLQLVLEDIEEAVAALEAAEGRANPRTCEKRTAERRANRGQLPEHLPRIVETLMPDPRTQGQYFILSGKLIVWLLYLPCVAMVLRRPNEGVVPAWLDARLAALPRWLRGHTPQDA